MPQRSAGLLLFREKAAGLEVLLVHPGGPFWAKKDAGAWSIPKGLIEEGEDPLAAARREFEEEVGIPSPDGEAIGLTPQRQPSGKIVSAWALRGDFDPAALKSGSFAMPWPPKSGKQQSFPEIDRAEWFTLDAAREKLLAGQRPFLEELERLLGAGRG
jgi:predicted NUDIX family NTP pyrophosphohydrolase